MNSRARFSFSLGAVSLTGLAALALAGCGTLGLGTGGSLGQHGSVDLQGPSAAAVVAGPATIHAYSEFAGGAMYSAPSVTGTDGDCRLAAGAAAPNATTLRADRVTAFAVRQGEIACLATSTGRRFELLWHAVKTPSSELTMARK